MNVYFRRLVVVLITCSDFTLTFCDTVDVICKDISDHHCTISDLNSTTKEVNFITNTQSYRDAKVEIIFQRCSLAAIPSGVLTSAYKNLKRLELSQCNLTTLIDETTKDASLAFYGGENILNLILHFNEIENIPIGLFNKLTKLKWLHLEYYKIKSLDETTFSSLTNLISLHLENNKLTVIGPNLFSQNSELSFLD